MTESGIELEIREGVRMRFTDLALDYTGTLSLDGMLLPGIEERLARLAQSIRITVLTADTFGQAEHQLEGLPVAVHIVGSGTDKARYVADLGPDRVIAIGNGRNDVSMLMSVRLGMGVIGPEGLSGELWRHADIVVTDIRHALDLLIHPLRLKATLRD